MSKTITLTKETIMQAVDVSTFKRIDAQVGDLAGAGDKTLNAVSSAHEEGLDKALILGYCNWRDARLRSRLRFCLASTNDADGYNDSNDSSSDYTYKFNVNDDFSDDDVRALGIKMHEYIVRGAIYDWYRYMNLSPVDSEQGLQVLEDTIIFDARVKGFGRENLTPKKSTPSTGEPNPSTPNS